MLRIGYDFHTGWRIVGEMVESGFQHWLEDQWGCHLKGL
jgi:hypothetical protein